MADLTFEKELEHLINKYSIDNQCNTPDFILAKYMVKSLEPLRKMIDTRAEWYGHTECDHTTDVLHKKH